MIGFCIVREEEFTFAIMENKYNVSLVSERENEHYDRILYCQGGEKIKMENKHNFSLGRENKHYDRLLYS